MHTNIDRLKYPIGKFSRPTAVSNADLSKWIEEIEMLPEQLRRAVDGLNDKQLDTPYRPNGWTLRQVIHHLPDSHINSYVRFKLALTEDNPTIKPYLEARWAELPDSKKGSVAVSVDLLNAVHKRWVMVLRNMSPEQWKRTFIHPESNKEYKLDEVACLYAWHGKHHLAHITGLRERMGW